jgi:biotin carboxyl carrier protein
MARAQVRKLGQEPTDDAVLIQLLFPHLAPGYRRGSMAPAVPKPVKAPKPEPVAVAAASSDPPPPANDPPASAAPATTTAEFDVEVDGEVFKVRVTGAGMAVMPSIASPAGASAPAAQPAGKPPARSGEGTVMAPMQGLIVKIPIKAGDDVKLGDVVAVLEAMKMQNDIVTTVAGKVQDVYVKEGEVVSPNQPLVAIG